MKKSIFILPTSKHTGLRLSASSMVYALQQKGLKVRSFHPIYDMQMSIENIQDYLLNNHVKDYVEIVLDKFYQKSQDFDFIIISGLFRQGNNAHKLYAINAIVDELNTEIIKALSSEVIITSYHGNKPLIDINDELDYAMRSLPKQTNIIGAVITKLNAPYEDNGRVSFSLTDEDISSEQQQQVTIDILRELPVFAQKGLSLIGVVEWQQEKTSPRILDIKNILKLNLISRVSLEAGVDRVMMCS